MVRGKRRGGTGRGRGPISAGAPWPWTASRVLPDPSSPSRRVGAAGAVESPPDPRTHRGRRRFDPGRRAGRHCAAGAGRRGGSLPSLGDGKRARRRGRA